MQKEIIKHWYITIIALFFFIYSALCWGNFVADYSSKLISKFKGHSSSASVQVAEKENDIVSDTTSQSIGKSDTETSPTNGKLNHIVSLTNKFDKYISGFESLWTNHMYKSSSLTRIDSVVTYLTLKEISSAQVILGKDNWLFYKSKTDGDSIADYEGTNRYTQEELDQCLSAALFTQNALEERGIEFVIMVAPNKENVYAEYMPDSYKQADVSSTDIMIDYLKDNHVNILSPKAELLSASKTHQIYYSYDTHWNQLGAYIGVKCVLDNLEETIIPLSEQKIATQKLNYHYGAEDDLANIVGLRELIYNDEIEYEISNTQKVNWMKYEEEQNSNQVSHFINKNAKSKKTLLLIGDSFRTSMIPSLSEIFSDVYVVHRSCYQTSALDDIKPDFVIAEYVERYSRNIKTIDSIIR